MPVNLETWPRDAGWCWLYQTGFINLLHSFRVILFFSNLKRHDEILVGKRMKWNYLASHTDSFIRVTLPPKQVKTYFIPSLVLNWVKSNFKKWFLSALKKNKRGMLRDMQIRIFRDTTNTMIHSLLITIQYAITYDVHNPILIHSLPLVNLMMSVRTVVYNYE